MIKTMKQRKFKAPFDMYGGEIKKGTISAHYRQSDNSYFFESTNGGVYFPAEIIETWEEVIEYDLSVRYQKGDLVKVLRKANDYEKEWSDIWYINMYDNIGKTLEVIKDSGIGGVGLSDGFKYPHFVLQKEEKEITMDDIVVGKTVLVDGMIEFLVLGKDNDCVYIYGKYYTIEHVNLMYKIKQL